MNLETLIIFWLEKPQSTQRTQRILREEFPHLKEWCGDHLWAPSCFHGSVGNGWEVVSKYIETQDLHHAKNAIYRPRP